MSALPELASGGVVSPTPLIGGREGVECVMPIRSRWRDDFWEKDGRRVHLPVNVVTQTVEITTDALADLLTMAGFSKVPDEDI